LIANCRLKGGDVDADELQRRTFDFARRVVRVVRAMPRTVDGRAIGGQLVRSGTSVGANYRACCKSRSRAEFVAKIGVVEDEINESVYWLELIVASAILPAARITPLLNEARELEKIFARSRITANRNRSNRL
jgi:four helix bundle protein